MKFEQFDEPSSEEPIKKEVEVNEFSPGEYLGKKYPDLKKSEAVELSHEYSEEKEKNKVDTWLKKMEAFHKRHRDNEIEMDMVKNALYENYVIKPEDVPESYFENQQRLARERGYGDIKITDKLKSQGIDIIIRDQKSTLDNWSEYIFSKDADAYPMWAKYWAMRSMVKLSAYDKEKKSFGTRRKDTVAPFPDLNREALAYVVDMIVKKAGKKNIGTEENNPELEKLIQSENFGKLYAYAIEKVTPTETNELANTEGEWKKYDQNSNHMPLVQSLQGHGTGWCTAGESTAEAQLKNGDFYVYYSKDREGNYTVPRAAIRMQGNGIGEIRGIGPDQNIDPYIGKIVDEKLKEFPDGEKYKKKTQDMAMLTAIEKKHEKNELLTKEDLRFLYEFDSKIEGFGHRRDSRIEEIKEKRDKREDVALITGYTKEEIGLPREGYSSPEKDDSKFYYGDIDSFSNFSGAELKLPEEVSGYVNLGKLTDDRYIEFPKKIGGNLYLNRLDSINKPLPQEIEGDLHLDSYWVFHENSFNNFPKKIGGNLYLGRFNFVWWSEEDGPHFLADEDKQPHFPQEIGGTIYIKEIGNKDLDMLQKKYPNLKFSRYIKTSRT